MKINFLIILICFFMNAFSQPSAKQVRTVLDETTVVKDSSGLHYPYVIWQKLMQNGNHGLRSKITSDGKTEFQIFELSAEAKLKRMEALPKPGETDYFKTGSRPGNFRFTDLEGNRFNLKELGGKVVVLNFWFINCGPCRKEIPDLNNLVLKYKDNPNVVFLAIGLDSRSDIKDFVKKSPFLYHLTENGRYLAQAYGVTGYPTHVVLDKSSKVTFHTNGLAHNTVFWIDKSIAAALNSPDHAAVNGG